jgi:hypothetical protein
MAAAGEIDGDVREAILQRVGRGPAGSDVPIDMVVASVDNNTDVLDCLSTWRARLQPAGSIWLLTPKRGLPGYVKQEDLIPAGREAGLIDNKICSVSDRQSAMRFVIPLRNRRR